MIESNNPEIDVNELMERVRAEADRIRSSGPPRQSGSDGAVAAKLPEPALLRPFPQMVAPESDLRADRLASLHDLLKRAQQATDVNPWIPKPFRRLFRKQGRYNNALIESVIVLFETLDRLAPWQNGVSADVQAQSCWLAGLNRVRENDVAWMRATARLLSSICADVHNLDRHVESIVQQSERLRDQLESLEEKNTATDEHLRDLQAEADRLGAVAADLQRDLAARVDVESLEQRQASDAAFIKAELSHQSRLVHKLVDQIAGDTAQETKSSGDGDLSKASAHQLDAFYFSFENRFRGPREVIKNRLRFYLPFLERCRAGVEERPIVDVGCGRGEWLELLGERDLRAWGIDLNEVMVAQCKARELDVVPADAVKFLQTLPDLSQGAVTGFHIIEHLTLETLVALFREAFRVLQPGGIAIFESPNCKNLSVGACNFYMDPTHRNPVFPETAQFMLESCGFERVSLEYLSPVDTSRFEHIDEEPIHLGELLYGPQDFAVIGYKSMAQ